MSSLFWFALALTNYLCLLAADMGKLSSMVALKPPKTARAKKDTVGEKRKKSLSPVHESLPELGDAIAEPDQNISEPVAPRKSKS